MATILWKQVRGMSTVMNAGSRSRLLVDLRSDTVTKPCESMRKAIYEAEVGDDVWGDDPTVKELESRASALLGKEAAIFMPSSTMCNLVAVGSHCAHREEVILGKKSHIFLYEGGGASAFMGVSYSTVPNQKDGTLSIEDIEQAIRPEDAHCPKTALVCLEDTQNACGGLVLPSGYHQEVAQFCQDKGLKLHLDGARIMNSAVATNRPVSKIVEGVDSVTLCLSKGLGAPIGGLLVGTQELVDKALYLRKSLGGGMRQVGVLAAAGLYALDNNIDKIAADHMRARKLAEAIADIPELEINLDSVQSNIVFFNVLTMTGDKFCQELEKHGVLMGGYPGGSTVRAVTHLDVSDEGIDHTIDVMKTVVQSISHVA